MPNHALLAAIGRVLAIAAPTAALTLAVAWPRTTNADPDDGSAAQAEHGTRFGNVVVAATIERTPETNAWTVKLHAHNRGDAPATLPLRAGLTRTVSDPRNRADPSPMTLWREDTSIELPVGGTSDATFAIPDSVAERLTRDAERPIGPWYAAPMGGPGGHVRISYDVVLLPRRGPGARSEKARGG